MNVSKLALWCVEFNQFLSNNQPSVFAAVGGTKISIFECLANGKFKFVLCFADPDVSIQPSSASEQISDLEFFVFFRQMKIFTHVVGRWINH